MLGRDRTLINCLVLYSVRSIGRDTAEGTRRAHDYHIFAHEAGHLLGLDETYAADEHGNQVTRDMRTASSQSGETWHTTSFPGYERNVMGDVINDIDHSDSDVRVPHGRAWLGWTQARDMAIRAYEVYHGVIGAYGEGSTLITQRGMPDYTVEMRSTSATSRGRHWWPDWLPF